MKVAKRLAGAVFIYGLGGGFSKFVGLLILPFMTRHLTPEDYGVIAMITIMITLLSGIVSLGTGYSMAILFNEEKSQKGKNEVIWSTAFAILLSSVICIIIGKLFSTEISNFLFDSEAFSYVIAIGIFQTACASITVPFLGRWRLEEKAMTYVIASVGTGLAMAISSFYAVVVLQAGVEGFFVSSALVQFVFLIIISIYQFYSHGLSIIPSKVQDAIKLGWPLMMGVGAFFVIDISARLILEHFHGLSSLGIYSIALSFGTIMVLLAENAFGAAWPAFFNSYVNKQEEAKLVFGEVLKYYLVLYLTLNVGFFVFANLAVKILMPADYFEAANLIGWIALVSVLRCTYLIFLPGIYFAKKLYLQSVLEWSAAIITLLSCFIFVPRFGLMGAAISPILGYVVLCLSSWIISSRYLKIVIELQPILLIGVLWAIAVIISSHQWTSSLYLETALRVVFYFAFCGGVVVLFARDKLHLIEHSWKKLAKKK